MLFFLKDNKKEFILWLNVPKVTAYAEMVFFEGDFYTARVALENLVRSANHRVIIIDGYVSSLTLPQQSYRRPKMAKRVP